MADKAVQDEQTVSDDEASEDSLAVDKEDTGAAAHRCLKRAEGKRVRLTNEQKAEIVIYADEHEHIYHVMM